VVLSEPVHTPEVLARHAIHEQMVRTREENLQRARLSKGVILEAAAALGTDPDAPMQLAILDNQIAEGSYKQNNEVQSKCWIQGRCNTATIGEPTKRGMRYSLSTEGRHSLSSLVSALSCFKTE
jgi:hypothetical protein